MGPMHKARSAAKLDKPCRPSTHIADTMSCAKKVSSKQATNSAKKGTSANVPGKRSASSTNPVPPKRMASLLSSGSSQEQLGTKQRQRTAGPVKEELRLLCKVVHQFGLVGGPDYDSKFKRLDQLLERLPAGAGRTVVLAEPASVETVEKIVECQRRRGDGAKRRQGTRDLQKLKVPTPCINDKSRLREPVFKETCPEVDSLPVHVDVICTGPHEVQQRLSGYQYVINYDTPRTGKQYLDRVASIQGTTSVSSGEEKVVYTFFEAGQLSSRGCKEVAGLLRRARDVAAVRSSLGGLAKAAEFDSALLQLEEDDEEDAAEQKDGSTDDGDSCDCAHCTSLSVGCATYHMAAGGGLVAGLPRVEVVRVHLRALGDLGRVAPLIAPRLPDHLCTVVCLHNLNCHTPWDGHEHLFALPQGMGSVRVVMVLANDCSWHDYPDVGSFSGGVSWVDILDVASMDETDQLISKLVDHEVALLNQQSERLFLMGMSQGGAQSMLRFLRSQRRLGGWLGAVCHAPTAPHLPRSSDPLLARNRSLANLNQPMRLLSGEVDTVFPAPLVLRDMERIRTVGRFTNVEVLVQSGLRHEGLEKVIEAEERGETVKHKPPQELLYLQEQWPSMVSHLATPQSPLSQ